MKKLIFLFLLFFAYDAQAFQVLSGSYAGNASDGREIFVGWTPQLCWITGNNGQSDKVRTGNHVGDLSFSFRRNMASSADYIQSFTSHGFTVGGNASVNESSTLYTWVCFRDNGDGDFKYGSYVGNGLDSTNISIQSGWKPTVLVIKSSSGTDTGTWRNSAHTGDAALGFHEFNAISTNKIQAFNNDGFQIGTSGDVNTSSATYFWVAWKESTGVASGKFVGDGADNRNLRILPWEPEVLWVKDVDSNPVNEKNQGHTGEVTSSHTFSAHYATDHIQKLLQKSPFGFQVGADTDVNTSGADTYWVAWRSSEQMF